MWARNLRALHFFVAELVMLVEWDEKVEIVGDSKDCGSFYEGDGEGNVQCKVSLDARSHLFDVRRVKEDLC